MVNFECCDILMYKSDGSFIQDTIAEVTKSQYVHSAIYVGKGNLIEANGFIKTREIPVSKEPGFDVFRIEGLSDIQKNKIMAYAKSKIGTSYDYEKIIGLLIRFELLHTFKGFAEADHFICSGLIDDALIAGGVSRKNLDFQGDIAPGELLTYYKLNRVIE